MTILLANAEETSPIFTSQQIKNLYLNKVKKDRAYFKKYEQLPLKLQKKWRWADKDFARVWCLLDFRDWVEKYHINPVERLAITCENDPELEFLSYKNITCIEYDPETEKGDLHALSIDSQFDFFLFNQTLEHLYNPFLALAKIYKSLKKGGYVFTSVPTISIPHDTPIHFWGMTPMGLAMLFTINKFEIKEMGQYGSYNYINKMFAMQTNWPNYRQLIHKGKIVNEEENCVQCWILAQKVA